MESISGYFRKEKKRTNGKWFSGELAIRDDVFYQFICLMLDKSQESVIFPGCNHTMKCHVHREKTNWTEMAWIARWHNTRRNGEYQVKCPADGNTTYVKVKNYKSALLSSNRKDLHHFDESMNCQLIIKCTPNLTTPVTEKEKKKSRHLIMECMQTRYSKVLGGKTSVLRLFHQLTISLASYLIIMSLNIWFLCLCIVPSECIHRQPLCGCLQQCSMDLMRSWQTLLRLRLLNAVAVVMCTGVCVYGVYWFR